MSNRPCDKNKKDKVLGKINLLQFVLHTTAPPALQMCSDRLGDIFVLPWASPSAVDVLAFHRGLGLSRNAISCVSEAHSSKSPHPHHHHHYHHPSPTPHKNKKEKKRKTPTTTEVFFLRDKTKLPRTHPHIPECIAAAYPSESRSHMLPRWEGVFLFAQVGSGVTHGSLSSAVGVVRRRGTNKHPRTPATPPPSVPFSCSALPDGVEHNTLRPPQPTRLHGGHKWCGK